MSPLDYVNAPNKRIVFTTVESTTIDGHDAARVIHQPSGEIAHYVVRANDRLYEPAPFILEIPSQRSRRVGSTRSRRA